MQSCVCEKLMTGSLKATTYIPLQVGKNPEDHLFHYLFHFFLLTYVFCGNHYYVITFL